MRSRILLVILFRILSGSYLSLWCASGSYLLAKGSKPGISAQIGSYSIQLGLSSWIRCGSGSSLSLRCGSGSTTLLTGQIYPEKSIMKILSEISNKIICIGSTSEWSTCTPPRRLSSRSLPSTSSPVSRYVNLEVKFWSKHDKNKRMANTIPLY